MSPLWLLIALPALTACAAHADLVDVKTHLNDLVTTQEEERKQHEVVLKRVQALEEKVGTKRVAVEDGDARSDKQRLQSLSARIKTLEDRFGRFEEALRSQTVTEYQAPPLESGQPEMSAQSKPSGLTPIDPAIRIPGTPAITPTSAFNLALNDYQSGRYELALTGFQRFVKDFPQANLVPDAYYWIGETYYSMKDYVRAIPRFELVISEYPRSEKVPAALFKLGLATAETGDTSRARTYLRRVIEQYKETTEAKLAKNRLADLR